MPVKEYLGWLHHFEAEPFGAVGLGLTVGRLAVATSESRGLAAEDFVVAAPTPREQEEIEEYERSRAEFENWCI